MVQRLGHYDGMRRKWLEVLEMWIWRRMERVNWRQNKKCSSARKSERRMNKFGTDEGEE